MRKLSIDYRAELEKYEWQSAKWSEDKLIAASPFRTDRSPSFYVFLDEGHWGDSGAIDDQFAKGGFVQLLAHLRAENIEDTKRYLSEKYGVDEYDYHYDDTISIDLSFLSSNDDKISARIDLSEYEFDYEYLKSRGISEEIQRRAGVRYSPELHACVFPWIDGNQTVRNVFYRSVRSKAFWYEEGGSPVRELLYGIDRVYATQAHTAVLCEAPIDALSAEEMWSDTSGVASGSASMSVRQAELIAKSPIRHVIVAGDNDRAGERFTEKALAMLEDYGVEAVAFDWREFPGCKDINDILISDSS